MLYKKKKLEVNLNQISQLFLKMFIIIVIIM